jgi:hypothetical protein
MSPNDYFNGVVIGVMAALIAGGVTTLGTTFHPRASRVGPPPEPAFSVGLILTYVPIIYVVGGGVGDLVRSSNPAVNAVLILLCVVAAHCFYLLVRERRSALETLVPADISRVAGLTDLFGAGMSEPLRAACQTDCDRVKRGRLVAPDLRELFMPGSAIGEALSDAIRRGMRLEVLTDGHIASAAELGLGAVRGSLEIVGRDPADASGHWLILGLGRTIYFGLRGDGVAFAEMPICRGVVTEGDDGSGQIVKAVVSVLEGFFDRARRGECFSRVATSSSPKTYRERIVPAEAGARIIARIPKRLSVVFKGEATVRSIAEQRFGVGSPSIEHYVQEHQERRQEFFAALSRGMVCREIYNEDEVIHYVRSREHSVSVTLSRTEITDTVFRWRQAIEMHNSYLVALTTDPIPFKYELIDGRLMSLHETIGVNDSHRLNAIFVEGRSVGEAFLSDFDEIWERVPPNRRSKAEILRFIDSKLVPLLQSDAGER